MHFIRQYNSLFAFTSIGVHVDQLINTGCGPHVFRINGVVHHWIGSLLPADGSRPEYAQLYIYYTSNEVQNRLSVIPSERDCVPDPILVRSLIEMLDAHNPLVRQFRLARDRLLSPTSPDIAIRLIGSVDSHGDRFSLPAVPELASLLVGGLTTKVNRFDVVMETKSGTFRQIYPLNPSLMALQYPLLFPHGNVSFHAGIKMRIVDPTRPPARENISMIEYYAYYAHYRRDEPNPILCSGRL
jgi:hypothetical protein